MGELNRYIRKIRNHMSCPQSTKTKLLKEYRDTIDAFYDISGLSLKELCEKFDDPKIVARNLMDGVSDSEIRKYKQFKTTVICLLLIAACVGLIVGCLFYQQSNYKDNIITDVSPTQLTKEN